MSSSFELTWPEFVMAVDEFVLRFPPAMVEHTPSALFHLLAAGTSALFPPRDSSAKDAFSSRSLLRPLTPDEQAHAAERHEGVAALTGRGLLERGKFYQLVVTPRGFSAQLNQQPHIFRRLLALLVRFLNSEVATHAASFPPNGAFFDVDPPAAATEQPVQAEQPDQQDQRPPIWANPCEDEWRRLVFETVVDLLWALVDGQRLFALTGSDTAAPSPYSLADVLPALLPALRQLLAESEGHRLIRLAVRVKITQTIRRLEQQLADSGLCADQTALQEAELRALYLHHAALCSALAAPPLRLSGQQVADALQRFDSEQLLGSDPGTRRKLHRLLLAVYYCYCTDAGDEQKSAAGYWSRVERHVAYALAVVQHAAAALAGRRVESLTGLVNAVIGLTRVAALSASTALDLPALLDAAVAVIVHNSEKEDDDGIDAAVALERLPAALSVAVQRGWDVAQLAGTLGQYARRIGEQASVRQRRALLVETLNTLKAMALGVSREPLDVFSSVFDWIDGFFQALPALQGASEPVSVQLLRLMAVVARRRSPERVTFECFFPAMLPRSLAGLLAGLSGGAQSDTVAKLLQLGCSVLVHAPDISHTKLFLLLLPQVYRFLLTYVRPDDPATAAVPALLLDQVISVLRACIDRHIKLESFLSYGVLLLLELHPSDEVRHLSAGQLVGQLGTALRKLSTNFVVNGEFCVVWSKYAYSDFSTRHFHDHLPQIRELFRHMFAKGQRAELQKVTKIFRAELLRPEYQHIRRHLFSQRLSKTAFDKTIDILIMTFAATATSLRRHRERHPTDYDQQPNLELEILRTLFLPLLARLESHISDSSKSSSNQTFSNQTFSNQRSSSSNQTSSSSNQTSSNQTSSNQTSSSSNQTSSNQTKSKDDQTVFADLRAMILRISTFRSLFPGEFLRFDGLSFDEVMTAMSARFPAQILDDDEAREAVTMLGERLDHINTARYPHVLAFAIRTASEFFAMPAASIRARRAQLRDWLLEQSTNAQIVERLVGHGYSRLLWQSDLTMRVEVDRQVDQDIDHFNKLLVVYTDYLPLLDVLGARLLLADGLPAAAAFAGCATLDQLRKRRSLVRQLLAGGLSRLAAADRAHVESRLAALKARENSLEAAYLAARSGGGGDDDDDEQAGSTRKSVYWVRWNKSFLRALSTCASGAFGCYAPDGSHTEKPVENGLKANAAFLSVYEEERSAVSGDGYQSELGAELENVEVLLTDQGVYVYKAYGNCGHNLSLVWMTFFKELLAAGCVPGVIVPVSHPDPVTYARLRRFALIDAEDIGSAIGVQDDFFAESPSYWDHRASHFKEGFLYLHAGNVGLLDDALSPRHGRGRRDLTASGRLVVSKEEQQQLANNTLRRSDAGALLVHHSAAAKPRAAAAPLKKDLTGELLAKVMAQLNKTATTDNQRRCYAATGRFISNYISQLVRQGAANDDTLRLGFELCFPGALHDSAAFVAAVVPVVQREMDALRDAADLADLARSKPHIFFELLTHLNAALRASSSFSVSSSAVTGQQRARLAERRRACVAELRRSISLSPLAELDADTQASVMKWIFRNEDEVWRDRGGRPSEETVDQFLDMLTPQPHCAYPGVIARCALLGDKIVGYAIGQLAELPGVSAPAYEIVTAFVDERARGVGLASQLYQTCFRAVALGCPRVRYVFFDVLDSSYEQLARSAPFFRLLHRWRLDRLLVAHRAHQYVSVVASDRATGQHREERFERIVLATWALRLGYQPARIIIPLFFIIVLLLAFLFHLLI